MIYVAEDQLLACALRNFGSERGITPEQLTLFENILKRIFNTSKLMPDTQLYIARPSSTLVYSSDYWREYYNFNEGKYYRNVSLTQKALEEQITTLIITIPKRIIEASIKEFEQAIDV